MRKFVETHNVLRYPKRAHSMFTSSSLDSVFSNQGNLKHQYQLYFQRRQPQIHKCTDKQEHDQASATSSLESSKRPTISWLLRDRLLIDQQLRKTMNKQRYERLKAEKKLKYLLRKKNKYEAVLRIRKQHNTERMKLSRLKTTHRQRISENQIALKTSVERSRRTLSDSISQSLAAKKQIASQLKQKQIEDLQVIAQNRERELIRNKRLHSEILYREKKNHLNRYNDISHRNLAGTQSYVHRLEVELKKNEKLERNKKKLEISVQKRRKKLHEAKQLWDKKIQEYSSELRQNYPAKLFRCTRKQYHTVKIDRKWMEQNVIE